MGMINYVKVPHVNLQDRDLPDKTYALSQSRGKMNVDELADHMSKHNTPFSKGVIKGILEDFINCTRELITDGWIVDLGGMGTFNVVLKSKGVCESLVDEETGKKPVFSASDITAVNCKYTPGSAFANMIDDCTFHEVVSRAKQQEAVEAANAEIRG